MSDHFHVVTVIDFNTALAASTFDNYEDSLLAYVHLSSGMYAHHFEHDELAIENAIQATENGAAYGAFTGTSQLGIMWVTCDGPPCYPVLGTWN